ncbi:MAG: hypothetical protein HY730_08955 [Candidatus Tectomicrobia bacterium]|uniref:Uncharacterized protein n=1 Tax=Tectimicrobiota bacterium TaxID=2528274 RepID=A0A933GMS5_UNCTE|nr:hypothetical protein [Candidatus Tectomicrobia bacterium]
MASVNIWPAYQDFAQAIAKLTLDEQLSLLEIISARLKKPDIIKNKE